MNMQEALEWAADYCERNHIFAPEMKSNGYPVDGYKAPTPSERVAVITDLARSAVTADPPTSTESTFDFVTFLEECVTSLEYAIDACKDGLTTVALVNIQTTHDSLFAVTKELRKNATA